MPLGILGLPSEPTLPRRLGATYSLPSWLPAAALDINEPAAVKVLGNIQRRPVQVETAELRAEIATSFWRTGVFASGDSPKLYFLHGADSSCLEWRYVVDRLGAVGFAHSWSS